MRFLKHYFKKSRRILVLSSRKQSKFLVFSYCQVDNERLFYLFLNPSTALVYFKYNYNKFYSLSWNKTTGHTSNPPNTIKIKPSSRKRNRNKYFIHHWMSCLSPFMNERTALPHVHFLHLTCHPAYFHFASVCGFTSFLPFSSRPNSWTFTCSPITPGSSLKWFSHFLHCPSEPVIRDLSRKLDSCCFMSHLRKAV